MMRLLGTIFDALQETLTDTVPPAKRLHKDFTWSDGDWFYNAGMKQKPARPQDFLKTRIFLNGADLSKLNDCPFPAKLGKAQDSGTEYCAFIYASPKHKIEDIESWTQARQFPAAATFTYGGNDPNSRQWKPGELVKHL